MIAASTAGQNIHVERRAADGLGCRQRLAHALFIVERGGQQKQLCFLGQVGHAGGERLLKPVGERQQARHRRAVLDPGGGDWRLDQRQRVAGGVAEDLVAPCWR